MANNWWNFSWINNWGAFPDPEGAFAKPDINILAPAGTAFTAPAAGRVTGINKSASYGDVVTVAFNNPPNSVATHYEFEHLASVVNGLFIGEQVSTGQILGYGGGGQSRSGAAPGFGLTDQASYGQGSVNEPFSSNGYINPLLNPTNFLSSLQGNNGVATTSMQQTNPNGGAPNDCCAGNVGCEVCSNIVSVVGGDASAICCGTAAAGVANGVGPQINNYLTKAGLILFGSAIVLIAVFVMFNRSK